MRYYRDHPPLPMMVQAYLGIKPRREVEAAPIEQFFAAWQSMGGSVG
jgi:hypothetical protein